MNPSKALKRRCCFETSSHFFQHQSERKTNKPITKKSKNPYWIFRSLQELNPNCRPGRRKRADSPSLLNKSWHLDTLYDSNRQTLHIDLGLDSSNTKATTLTKYVLILIHKNKRLKCLPISERTEPELLTLTCPQHGSCPRCFSTLMSSARGNVLSLCLIFQPNYTLHVCRAVRVCVVLMSLSAYNRRCTHRRCTCHVSLKNARGEAVRGEP